MYLMNDGSMYVNTKYANELFDMCKEICEDIDRMDDNVTGITEIHLSECDGDIDDELDDICRYFSERGVIINGEFEYWGDYDGKIVIENNCVRSYDDEEYGANEILKGNSIGLELKEKLLNELDNFNGNESIEYMKKMINEAATAD